MSNLKNDGGQSNDSGERAPGIVERLGNAGLIILGAALLLGILFIAAFLVKSLVGGWAGLAILVTAGIALLYALDRLKRSSEQAVLAAYAVACGVGADVIFYMVARPLHAREIGAAVLPLIYGAATLIGIWAWRHATAQLGALFGEDRIESKLTHARITIGILAILALGPWLATQIAMSGLRQGQP